MNLRLKRRGTYGIFDQIRAKAVHLVAHLELLNYRTIS